MKKFIFILTYLSIQVLSLFGQESTVHGPSIADANSRPKLPVANTAGSNASDKMVLNFDVYNQKRDPIPAEDLDNHFLGNEIARKIYYLDQVYTYKVAIAPGNPSMKTIVRKPTIYESVKTIEHYLKKSTRAGELNNEQATAILNKVLDVALNVFSLNTNELEQRIKTEKKPADLVNLYENYIQLNYIN